MDINRYEDMDVIHRGRKNTVYRATRKEDKKIVAIKTSSMATPGRQEYNDLVSEFHLMENINCSDVPTVYDLLEHLSKVSLEMTYIEAPPLRSTIKNGPMDVESFFKLFIPITATIGSVHQHDLVHRDVTPQNILWNPTTEVSALIDFGAALEIPMTMSSYQSMIKGTHPYISPEQTGRINRPLDYRTDFYSLGITMYEAITGKLPFEASDIHEMIYQHIAVEPIPPKELIPGLPHAINQLILKCIEKDPDRRYKSAQGLKADLVKIENALSQNQSTENILLGEDDFPPKLILSERLYGRLEAQLLLSKDLDTTSFLPKLCFVTGHSGVGKTVFIRAYQEHILMDGGRSIYGKFDQYTRNIPYSALMTAGNELIGQILMTSKDQKNHWQSLIVSSLGDSLNVLTGIIPNLALLMETNTTAQPLAPEEARVRLEKAFIDLLKLFAGPDQPLLIMLDDLQWIDNASLKLMEAMALEESLAHVQIVGTYRDNEVDDDHPLTSARNQLTAKDANISSIHLSPLTREDIHKMVADSLHMDYKGAEELAGFIYDSSEGNPLFAKAMLTAMDEQNYLTYNFNKKRWQWHMDQIEAITFGNEILSVMKLRLENLEEDTLNLLKLAAYLGSSFDLNIVAHYFRSDVPTIIKQLKPALKAGLISADQGNQGLQFHFAHDRIQQACYDMQNEEEGAQRHYEIAQIYLKHLDQEGLNDVLFQFTRHLLLSMDLISENKPMMEKAQYWLTKAGEKAKASVAFTDAMKFFSGAVQMLPDTPWDSNYEKTLCLHLNLCEVSYQSFDYDLSDNISQVITDKVQSQEDLLQLYRIRSMRFHQQALYDNAIEIGYKALSLLGTDLPKADDELMALFSQEHEKISQRLKNHVDLTFITEKASTCHHHDMALEILVNIYSDAYLVGKGSLLAATSALMARLAMDGGHNPYASVAYIYYASTLSAGAIDYDLAYKLGRLAIDLSDDYGFQTWQNLTYHVFCLAINHWKDRLSVSENYWWEASKLSLAAGSAYSGYTYLQLAHVKFVMGASLDMVMEQIDASKKFLTRGGHEGTLVLLSLIVEQPTKALLGLTPSPDSLDDGSFSTEAFMQGLGQYPFFKGSYLYSLLRINYLSGVTMTLESLEEIHQLINSTQQGQIIVADTCFYHTLHLMRLKDSSDQIQAQIQENYSQLLSWSNTNPMNFLHKALAIDAMIMSPKKDFIEVLEKFDLAIDQALKEKFIHEAALICELAGLHLLDHNKTRLAKPYMEQAYMLYDRWGAKIKKDALRREHPTLLDTLTHINVNSDAFLQESSHDLIRTESLSERLDFMSIIKATQAISRHMVMDKLADELIHIAVQSAGATMGNLILNGDEGFSLRSTITKTTQGLSSQSAGSIKLRDADLPIEIINYVIQTRKELVLDAALTDSRFSHSSYIQKKALNSVCCIPITQGSQLQALIYLENTEVKGAFLRDRIRVLQILATQAFISIDNAKAYEDLDRLNKNLESKVKERTQELKEKNQLLESQNEALAHMSITDQLTDIYNRGYMERILDKLIEENMNQENKNLSVILFDVDRFKQVNDTYGHNVGDLVLKHLVRITSSEIRKEDYFGRWGGEEFLIILTEPADLALSLAERIRSSLEKAPHPTAGVVTASFGVASYQGENKSSRLIHRSDEALYEAKAHGRNQVRKAVVKEK